MKQRCWIILHRNYAEGSDAHAFWNLEDAQSAVEEEVAATEQMLRDDAYAPEIIRRGNLRREIYVPDSGIYYEWEIIGSTIE